MLYFHSWSGGKDSTASVILDHIHGLPPSTIIFSEVMFDKKRGISGELPEHIDFVKNKAKPLFESWGYKVEILHSDRDYLDLFFQVTQKSKVPERNGKYAGWLLGGMCYANPALKIKPIKQYIKALGSVLRLMNRKGSHGAKEQTKYRFSNDMGTQKEWRMSFAKNTTCFHRRMKFQSAAVAGFVQIKDMRNLHTQRHTIRNCGKSLRSWIQKKT